MKLRGYFFLMMAAFIWGTAFVAQMAGMDDLGPFTYAMARYFMGFVFLLLVWLGVRGKRRRRQENGMTQSGWKAGLGAGTIMLIATSLQQVAMVYTTAGKTAFITALYIVFRWALSCSANGSGGKTGSVQCSRWPAYICCLFTGL